MNVLRYVLWFVLKLSGNSVGFQILGVWIPNSRSVGIFADSENLYRLDMLDHFYVTWVESVVVLLFTLSDQIFFVPRCNCVSLVDGISDHAAAKAWEQRWVRACVCGGSWRKLPFKEQQNVVAAASTAAVASATTAPIPVASR